MRIFSYISNAWTNFSEDCSKNWNQFNDNLDRTALVDKIEKSKAPHEFSLASKQSLNFESLINTNDLCALINQYLDPEDSKALTQVSVNIYSSMLFPRRNKELPELNLRHFIAQGKAHGKFNMSMIQKYGFKTLFGHLEEDLDTQSKRETEQALGNTYIDYLGKFIRNIDMVSNIRSCWAVEEFKNIVSNLHQWILSLSEEEKKYITKIHIHSKVLRDDLLKEVFQKLIYLEEIIYSQADREYRRSDLLFHELFDGIFLRNLKKTRNRRKYSQFRKDFANST